MVTQRFSRCILHIGTEKTGTTSLQTFLGINRDALLKRGFFVPRSLSPYPVVANHETLTTIALNPVKLDDDRRATVGLRTVGDVMAWRLRAEDEFTREITASPHQSENSPTLLLSNEHCQSRLVEREEVRYLRRFLDKFADETHVVVYLRPQHELAISQYSTLLRTGFHDINVLPDFAGGCSGGFDKLYFEYDKLLDRWAAEFGREKITARLYSKENLEGNNVIQDFMSVAGCSTDGLQLPANENVSLSVEHQTALNAINRYVASQSSHATRPLQRHKLLAAVQAAPSEEGGNAVKRDDAIRFFHTYDDSNERVRKEYFPSAEQLFRPDFNVFPVDDPPKINEIDAVVRVIVELFTVPVDQDP